MVKNSNVTLKIRTKGAFNKVYVPFLRCQQRIQIYFGGSSSGKSVFLADRCVLDVINGRNYLICRKTGNTLRRSTFNEIIKAISKFQVTHLFTVNKSDMLITCTANNRQIMFVGLDDVEKVKSITPADGVITDIWVEEATETMRADIKQLEKRLRGRSKFVKRLHISFNPILKTHWIYIEWFKDFWVEGKSHIEREGLSIFKTTFEDNEFLEDDDKEALRNEPDEYYREVYSFGNWGILGHTIYKNWKIKEFDTSSFDNWRNGIDWGFADHPFAFVRMHYDKTRRKLYICEEICETKLLNTESSNLVKNKIGIELVYCDSAEPKSVVEYQQLGLNAYGAKKGPGSVAYGIKFVQGLEIIIHPKCQAFINQIQTYQFKEDKYGDALPKPVDKDDDLLDAMRYGLEQDSLHAELAKDEGITIKALQAKDPFDPDYERFEDELHVTWRNGHPLVRPELDNKSRGRGPTFY